MSADRVDAADGGGRDRRLFVAIAVPPPQAARFTPVLQALTERGARAIPPDRLHLTAAFMAAVPHAAVEVVGRATCRAAADTASFSLATTGAVDRFGQRVAWAELEPAPGAEQLAMRLHTALDAAGIALPERSFRAHLTLARAGRRRITPDVVADLRAPRLSWSVDEVVLVESTLGSGPARWERRAVCPLAARVPPA